jgi:hypothetical protein
VPADPWIIVPSWRKFQHYTDRDPPWIKLYTELGSNDDWLELTDAECGLLVRIWVEYARSRGVLRASRVPAAALQKNRRRGLERLVQAGFIHFSASRPLALAHSKEKKDLREDSDPGKSGNKTKPQKPVDERVFARPDAVCPDCGETLGAGHLESCPRMPRLEEARQ